MYAWEPHTCGRFGDRGDATYVTSQAPHEVRLPGASEGHFGKMRKAGVL